MKIYKKVIFLDIDGVLIPVGESPDRFNAGCVEQLNRILLATGAEIVISSSWRELMNLDELRELFRENSVAKLPVDVTPVLYDKTRKDEIVAFMKQNLVYNFVVIDDLPDAFVKRFDEFIQIRNPRKGLGPVEADKAIEVLNG